MTQPTVLVPCQSREFFQCDTRLDLQAVFYARGYETPIQKGMRKIGLRGIHQTLDAKFRIAEGARRLDDILALWISAELYLSPAQMECLLSRLPTLKWVYSQVTGTDHLDLEIFRRRGIMVSNTGDLSSRRVAEFAVACIFAHAKKLHRHFAIQRRHSWESLPCDDLHRQTVGIVGTGNIGRDVAVLCRSIGMQVIGASRNPHRFGDDPSPYSRIVPLDGGLDCLLAESDHVVLALPLTGQTRRFIGRNEFDRMKRGCSLINVARAAIVDEDALCKALEEGRIGGAYVDPPGSLGPSHFRRKSETANLVLTHYSAANSACMAQEAYEQFVDGLQDLLRTGQPPNRVA